MSGSIGMFVIKNSPDSRGETVATDWLEMPEWLTICHWD